MRKLNPKEKLLGDLYTDPSSRETFGNQTESQRQAGYKITDLAKNGNKPIYQNKALQKYIDKKTSKLHADVYGGDFLKDMLEKYMNSGNDVVALKAIDMFKNGLEKLIEFKYKYGFGMDKRDIDTANIPKLIKELEQMIADLQELQRLQENKESIIDNDNHSSNEVIEAEVVDKE